jgi:nucleoprotein TPR
MRRVAQENDILQKEIALLRQDYEQQSNTSLTHRQKTTSVMTQLRTDLSEAQAEATSYKAQHATADARATTLAAQLHELQHKLEVAQTERLQSEQTYRNEALTKDKMATLYKNAAAEADGKVQELTSAVAQLQQGLQAAQQQVDANAEHVKEQNVILKDRLAQSEAEIKRLKTELANANHLIAQDQAMTTGPLAQVSAAAAAANSAMKEGMSLTEMWTELLSARKRLALERQEVERLEDMLNTIVHDVETQAPVFQQQRVDLKAAEEARAQLTRTLEEATERYSQLETQWRQDKAFSLRNATLAEQLQSQLQHLAKQVQVLLKENTQLKGGLTSDGQAMDADDDEQLFATIEELHQQNMVFRQETMELKAQQAAHADEVVKQAEEKLHEELQGLAGQLQELRDARQIQETMATSALKQRDMFKALFTQSCAATGADPNAAIQVVMSANPRQSATGTEVQAVTVAGGNSAANNQALKELQRAFEDYKKERVTTDDLSNTEMERARGQVSDLQIEKARLETQLDHSKQRYDDLEGSVKALRAEQEHVQTRYAQVSGMLAAAEGKIKTIEAEANAARRELAAAVLKQQHLMEDKALREQREQQLEQQNLTLINERKSQQEVLMSLQTLQQDMRRAEDERRTRYSSQIEQLTKESQVVRQQMEQLQQTGKSAAVAHQKQLDAMRKELEEAQQAHHETREQLAGMSVTADMSKKGMVGLQGQLKSAEERLTLLLAKSEGRSVSS